MNTNKKNKAGGGRWAQWQVLIETGWRDLKKERGLCANPQTLGSCCLRALAVQPTEPFLQIFSFFHPALWSYLFTVCLPLDSNVSFTKVGACSLLCSQLKRHLLNVNEPKRQSLRHLRVAGTPPDSRSQEPALPKLLAAPQYPVLPESLPLKVSESPKRITSP